MQSVEILSVMPRPLRRGRNTCDECIREILNPTESGSTYKSLQLASSFPEHYSPAFHHCKIVLNTCMSQTRTASCRFRPTTSFLSWYGCMVVQYWAKQGLTVDLRNAAIGAIWRKSMRQGHRLVSIAFCWMRARVRVATLEIVCPRKN